MANKKTATKKQVKRKTPAPKQPSTAVAVRPPVEAIASTEQQVDLIKKTVAVGATDQELQLFLYTARKVGLDPLARQFYFIKRAGKATMQASIDGLRVVAQRSGDYAGQDEPTFEGVKNGVPEVAKVTVYKFSPAGIRYAAAVGVARWSEYAPADAQGFMWKKMPHTMLAKVAEALALRKAFPQDLSGIYSTDEMAQATGPMRTEGHISDDQAAAHLSTLKVPEHTEVPVIDENEPIEHHEPVHAHAVPANQFPPARMAPAPHTHAPGQQVCPECGGPISQAEVGFSQSRYGRIACRACQKNLTPIQR